MSHETTGTMFALVAWRVINWSRDYAGVPRALMMMVRVVIFSALFPIAQLYFQARDSTVYFALYVLKIFENFNSKPTNIYTRIFALLLVNLFIFEFAPPFLASLFVTPVNAVGCIAVSDSPCYLSPIPGNRCCSRDLVCFLIYEALISTATQRQSGRWEKSVG